jgi:hypothetical protein
MRGSHRAPRLVLRLRLPPPHTDLRTSTNDRQVSVPRMNPLAISGRCLGFSRTSRMTRSRQRKPYELQRRVHRCDRTHRVASRSVAPGNRLVGVRHRRSSRQQRSRQALSPQEGYRHKHHSGRPVRRCWGQQASVLVDNPKKPRWPTTRASACLMSSVWHRRDHVVLSASWYGLRSQGCGVIE